MATPKVGVVLSDLGDLSAGHIGRLAREAEELGFDSLFLGDHLLPAMPYPESTAVLGAAAAATERIRIGFGVMVLALRPVAWAAKQLATLQHLSGNRVVLGVGSGGGMHGRAGWDAVGVPYEERGRRTDESLELLPGLIAGEPTRVNGADVALAPGASVPPVWIGGNGDRAIRRTARFGDAWYPSMLAPERVRPSRQRLAELAERHGRPAPAVMLGATAGLGSAVTRQEVDELVSGLVDGYGLPYDEAARLTMTGGPDEAADWLGAYAEAGVEHVVVGAYAGEARAQWELLAKARSRLGHAPA